MPSLSSSCFWTRHDNDQSPGIHNREIAMKLWCRHRRGTPALKDQLQCELNHSRIAGAQDFAEIYVREIGDRVQEVGMVQHIEELGAKLGRHPLGYRDALERREVEVDQTRATQRVAAGTAKRADCIHREGGGVEPFR